MNKSLFVFGIIILCVSLASAGCETAKGAGKDMENTGKNVQKTIEHND